MPKPKPLAKRFHPFRILLGAALVVGGIAVLAAHWATVKHSVDIARDAWAPWLVLSLVAVALTFATAAAIYCQLALHQLRYRPTVLVELASAFVNRLLPAGLGGLGLHGLYLYKHGHKPAEATAVVSVNNLLGMGAHLLLLAAVGAASPEIFGQFKGRHTISGYWLLLAAGVILLLLLVPWVRRKLTRFIKNLLVSVRKIGWGPAGRALLLAATLTALYTIALLCSARAVGIKLNVLKIFVVFSVGMLVGTAAPTPGGLVGAEAGLFAGFVAYGVPSAPAGAAVLLYRLLSYWLPLLPGAVALAAARKLKLV